MLAVVNTAIAAVVLAGSVHAEDEKSEKLVCCGAEEVYIIDATNPTKKLWSWIASDSPSIPDDFRSKFRSTDDCKPYAGGLILITSSARGVALVRRDTKQCLFLAEVQSAHSACLLPGRQIAVAASTSGDAVQFFSLDDAKKPASVQQQIPLLGAHGTVWDATRKRLWALGTDEILQIEPINDSKAAAAWEVVGRYGLPSSGGHDLSPDLDDTHLFVTTDTQVLRFNMNDHSFELMEGFDDQLKIKSVDVHPLTKRVVFMKALPDEWWSHTIRFADAPPVTLGDQRLYKIRWDVSTPQP